MDFDPYLPVARYSYAIHLQFKLNNKQDSYATLSHSISDKEKEVNEHQYM